MMIHDQHVHSEYSHDSDEKLIEYFKRASELGCCYVVTTDHYDIDLVEQKESWIIDFDNLKKDLMKCHKIYPNIKPLLGIEIGYKVNHLEEINEVLGKEEYDLINLSIHDGNNIDYYFYKYYEKYGVDFTINDYFDNMIYATSTFTNYDVLSHIDYGFKTAYLNDKNISIKKYENKIRKVFNNLVNNNKAFEINTKVQESINSDEHIKYLLKLYKECGGTKITISSDAHSVSRYLSSFEHYKNIAKESGFDHLVYFIKRKEYIYNI